MTENITWSQWFPSEVIPELGDYVDMVVVPKYEPDQFARVQGTVIRITEKGSVNLAPKPPFSGSYDKWRKRLIGNIKEVEETRKEEEPA